MAIILRDYQKTACKELAKAVSQHKRMILFAAPTGAGKTVIMADFATKMASLGYKTLIVVDRVELLKQTVSKQQEIPFGYLKPDKFQDGKVVVSMLQTLRSRLKQELYQRWLETFDLIFIDEIQQSREGTTFKRIKDFSKDKSSIVGVSATPWNAKGYLLDGFDTFIKVADISELIEQGYLVKPVHYTVELFDFSKVKVTSTGDYDTGAIDDIVINTDKMDKVLENWLELAKNKKTIAFCSTVTSAKQYSNFFKLNGIKAQVVSAQNSDQERANILLDFKNGKIDILFNVGLLVAGFDEPSIECVVFLNPTKILRRYIQCAGRGLRLCPEIGKKDCLFLDFVGNSFRHLEVDAIRSYVHAPEKQEREDFDEIECPACGFVFPISEGECPECGFKLELDIQEGGSNYKPKAKKEFEKLIKLKSLQQELHDVIYEFSGKNCMIKTDYTGNKTPDGRDEKKWVYGYRDDGTPIFKTDKEWTALRYPYPIITQATKNNCWFVFHTICKNFDPKQGALRYYGRKLRKAKRFLEQINDPRNMAFVYLYRILD